MEAVQRLLELESQIEIPDPVWQRLEPFFATPAYFAAVSETNRDVAFRQHPIDFAEWLDNLFLNISVISNTVAA